MWARSTTLISDFGRVDIFFGSEAVLCIVLAALAVFGTHFDRLEAQFCIRLGALWQDDLGGFLTLVG